MFIFTQVIAIVAATALILYGLATIPFKPDITVVKVCLTVALALMAAAWVLFTANLIR